MDSGVLILELFNLGVEKQCVNTDAIIPPWFTKTNKNSYLIKIINLTKLFRLSTGLEKKKTRSSSITLIS